MPAITNGTVTLEKYVDKFTAELDGVVTQGTCTADLNMNQDLLGEFSGAGVIEVAKITMDGLADHRRGSGFVAGKSSLEWEPLKLEFDRDREFTVSADDDEETASVLSANLMNEFARTKVVPEIDAVRFARIYEFLGNGQKAAATITTASDAVAAVQTAEAYLEDLGIELSGCIFYTSATFKNLLRNAQNWQGSWGTNPNTGITEYDGMKLVTPARTVFKTAVKLLDGTTSGEEAGGFTAAEGAKDFNFLIIDPRAVGAIAKHQELRYFAPNVNQKGKDHLWQYHLYHDLLSYDNKKAMIYGHTKA